MNKLVEKLNNLESGLLIYSLTPPKEEILDEKLQILNKRRAERISRINFDALSIYDVQEEKSRNKDKRTFEYKAALNPLNYGRSMNVYNNLPQIIYLAAGKYNECEIKSILKSNKDKAFVLVGSPCRKSPVKTTLKDALKISSSYNNPVGAVLIGERHQNGNSEVHRVLSKIENGADFFISQCIYDVNIYEKFLEDYALESNAFNYEMKPIMLTFSPIGNKTSLEFLQWLGIQIPDIFLKDLPETDDFLALSIEYLENIAKRLIDICISLDIPFGINFESVIGKKAEVMASLELAEKVSEYLKEDQSVGSFNNFTKNLNSGVSALSRI